MQILKIIKNVISKEIETLKDINESIDENFEKVVKLLFESKNKLILTGVGKSGLIAKKIIATLISTGTPAFFLHPTEAIHGDLGIIQKNDFLLAITKSGNTQEILDIIPVVKKIGAKLVVLTADRNSKIASQSDYVLYMPIKEEACPLNLAPTSSTTASLVIGDAIAVALMTLRGFQPENFALFHPGGSLGKKLLLKVSDIMRTGDKNSVIKIEDSIEKMFFEITNKMTGAVSVIDENFYLKGFITDFDIRRVFQDKKDIFGLTIPQIMNTNPKFIFFDESVKTALDFMEKREKPISVLPVLDRATNKVVGILHLHDMLR